MSKELQQSWATYSRVLLCGLSSTRLLSILVLAEPTKIAECATMESSNFITPDGCGAFTGLKFFVSGVVVLAVVEVLLALYLLQRLLLNTTSNASASSVESDLKVQQSEDFSIRLQVSQLCIFWKVKVRISKTYFAD